MVAKKLTIFLFLHYIVFVAVLHASFDAYSILKGRAIQGRACEELLTVPPQELGVLREDFIHDSTRYAIELPTTEIRNQCAMGNCWIYAALADLETRILIETKKMVNLSEAYLTYLALVHKTLDALKNPGLQIGMGNFMTNANWLIEQYGIVPDEVWQPRVFVSNKENSLKLFEFLDGRVAQYHLAFAKAQTNKEKARLYRKASKDVLDILQVYFGDVPESFQYNGRTYASPKDFAESLPVIPRLSWTCLVPVREPLPENLRGGKQTNASTQFNRTLPNPLVEEVLTFDEIEQKIVENLKQGKPVPISFESVDAFIDKKTGIMSIDAFFHPEGFETPQWRFKHHFGWNDGNHIVLIVGVDLDSTGQIIKFKIKNSWGEKTGDHGTFHMYRDYFRAYLNAAYIKDDSFSEENP